MLESRWCCFFRGGQLHVCASLLWHDRIYEQLLLCLVCVAQTLIAARFLQLLLPNTLAVVTWIRVTQFDERGPVQFSRLIELLCRQLGVRTLLCLTSIWIVVSLNYILWCSKIIYIHCCIVPSFYYKLKPIFAPYKSFHNLLVPGQSSTRRNISPFLLQ